MDDQYWQDLAERWEALRVAGKVHWVEGMRNSEGRMLGYVEAAHPGNRPHAWWCLDGNGWEKLGCVGDDLTPDLRDPATVGVLLSQWREVCGNPYASVDMRRLKTEPEAIITALEALP